MRPGTRWRGAGLLLGLGLILALSEAVLRWGVGLGDPPIAVRDADLEYRLRPNQSYLRWGNRIDINDYGLRAPDIGDQPEPDRARVLLLGDSVVYGNHFLDQTETIASQMSSEPSAKGCGIEAIPLALSSWGPVNQAAALARFGTLDAKAALLVLSAHDLYDTPNADTPLVPFRMRNPLLALEDAAISVYERILVSHAPPDPRPREARAHQSLEAMTAILARLRQDAIPLWLIYHPSQEERAGRVPQARETLLGWAQAHEVPVVDLGQALPELVDGRGYRDALHPDAIGAAALASTLEAHLRTHGICQ